MPCVRQVQTELAFETIVASGYCSAYPHGTLLDKTIREGDFVVVDLGATYKYYRSDITRTFMAGKAIRQTEKESTQPLSQLSKKPSRP